MDIRPLASPDDQSVTFVELFFDLVFVFSITQVVDMIVHHVSWTAVGQALLVFWVVWWAWTQFTWALNAADTDHPRIQLTILLATGTAFVMAVAVPTTFTGLAPWFAVPYVLVRSLALILYVRVASGDEKHRNAVVHFALGSSAGMACLLTGALLGGNALYWLWGTSIALDIVAALFAGGQEGWNIHPAHFVERHGLIVIIVLGESLVVAGAGATGRLESANVASVALASVILTCLLWWSYFPYVKPRLERALKSASGIARSRMARDVFSLFHFPMMCGVIALAASIKLGMTHPEDPMGYGIRALLGCGLVLFVGGVAAVTWRALGTVRVSRAIIVTVTGASIIAFPSVMPPVAIAIASLGTVLVVIVEHRSVAESIAFK